MKILSFFSHIPYKKSLAGVLVAVILISQTIHVDFFDRVEAGPENYRDIVSIIVDRDTYASERSRVLRYAEDIASYLGGVRTSVLVIAPGTSVATIAQKNEKLYYEGDGEDGTSALVGTVLIGNIPVPLVTKDGTSFPSLFPYVDFVDKAFVYDEKNSRYTHNSQVTNEGVEIWHGIINPSVGRSWNGATDIKKIGQFLDKTHESYTKSGKFAPSSIPPKVLYYDGQSESRSIELRSLFQYGLSMKNAENIAYNRFTKHLLRDISTNIQVFDKTKADPEISALYASLGVPEGSDTLTDEQIVKLPDIQTKTIIQGFLKNFKEIFNEKSLGEELLAVHNAGRYNSGASVGADLLPVSISLMDDIARSTLKTSNQSIATLIDSSVSSLAKRITIYDKSVIYYSGTREFLGGTYTGSINPDGSPNFVSFDGGYYGEEPGLQGGQRVYQNYFFGKQSTDISDPSQCTIARGYAGSITPFGRSVLAEANAAFDVGSAQPHIDFLKKDTEQLVAIHNNATYSCFGPTGNSIKTQSYWGGNSILAQSKNSTDSFLFDPSPAANFREFTSPIYSLGGMKETTRLSNPSIKNCIDTPYQYTILQPYLRSYSDSIWGSRSRTVAYPDEWNKGGKSMTASPRFTCIDPVHSGSLPIPLRGGPISLETSMSEYSTRSCFAGKVFVDGVVVKQANNTCSERRGHYIDEITVDTTHYEDRYYHTIPSVWSHVSPTDQEIAAAKANGTTPSLAVDQIRFVEYLAQNNSVTRIDYPNFFEIQGKTIAEARAWITSKSQGIPIDLNKNISDEMITKILLSKNWMHGDISLKYKKTIASLLSYSHKDTSVVPLTETAPEIPSRSNEYEIAYLGLPTSFGPDFSLGVSSTAKESYATKIREIEGANISEETPVEKAYNPSSECGPPDGVPLLQWPSAIMCWIKAQFPPRIIAGACGPITIGMESPFSQPLTSPSQAASANKTALLAFYTGAQLVPHIPRSSLQLSDSISIDMSLRKGDTYLRSPVDTLAKLEIVRITSLGQVIPSSKHGEYVSIEPNNVPVLESGANFILSSLGKEAIVTLRSVYTSPLPDGSEMKITSAEFGLNITPEYFLISLNQSGSTSPTIDVTSTEGVKLNINKVLKNGNLGLVTGPMFLDIYDDINGQIVYSGSAFDPIRDNLPVDITKKIGVYRLVLQDKMGVGGEMTFSVESGKFSQLKIIPVSTALIRGNKTMAMIKLMDRLGNPISPDLHTVRVDVDGGYLVDTVGNKKISMTMDIMESQVPVIIGSDSSGKLTINVTVDNTIKSNREITIHNSARIALMREREPQVGGSKVPVRIEIQDEKGLKIPGFSSIGTLKLPQGAGTFSRETITITDGVSENFDYIPGTVAGDHILSIDIPGAGSLSNVRFSLLPGDPLYVTHNIENDSIIFSLRDRYNNIVTNSSLVGSIVFNNDAPVSISFTQGKYTIPMQGGYYTVTVPGLQNNKIAYTDESGEHVINGIDTYVAYIAGKQETINFAPDYNARYTVLPGGAFLREGEDILYNTIPGGSQSLAVSTILVNPKQEDVLLSVFPGGSYALHNGLYGSVIESSISLSDGFPLLSVIDTVSRESVARVAYNMNNAKLEGCKIADNEICDVANSFQSIRMIIPADSTYIIDNRSSIIALNSSNENILNIDKSGKIQMLPSVTLVPKNTPSFGLQMGVIYDGQEIATLVYMTNAALSVSRNTTPVAGTPTIISSGFSIATTSNQSLQSDTLGYKIFKTSSDGKLDETHLGPNNIDSLGSLSEVSGVGWQGNNTMMLAYAGGDSVGEATRFFHTYTLVNLGDPVTHVNHNRPGTEIEGIDRTVGSIITRSQGAPISDYFHRDMDADGIEDLIVLYGDGYMELFLNRKGKFRSRGMITYNKDLDNRMISFGDFVKDGYGDIIGVNNKGDLILVDNSDRKFARRTITLENAAPLPIHISQLKIYDMDTDGRDDIVYLTAGGELGILYGTNQVGVFAKKVLDPTLGIVLNKDPITTGGAIKASNTPQFNESVGVSPSDSTTPDDSMLKSEVYYQYSHPTPIPSVSVNPETLSGILDDIGAGSVGSRIDTFVRSQYAIAHGLSIEKTYTNKTNATLFPDDLIEARIIIKNTTNATIRNIEYLDTIPNIFSLEKTQKYTIKQGNTSTNRAFESLGSGDYDMYFIGRDIAPGESLEFIYELTALPASYGEMIVGDLEKNTVGADSYGDVGFKTSTTCGASMLLWVSGPESRDYTRSTLEFGSTSLPTGLSSQLTDLDKNKIPDSIENLSLADRQKKYNEITSPKVQDTSFVKASQQGGQLNLGFDDSTVNSIIDATQNLMDGLSCGFGGGSCLNFPLNWAPLAPGSSPSLFGFPLNIPGMSPSSGLPIFSSLTGLQMMCGTVPCCIPTVYPISTLGYVPGPACGLPSAGGMLGTWAPTNTLRIYVTPTLTLGMGTAVCFGGPASAMGQIPPPGLSPFIQGGNCIVVAKPMNVCKSDGSSSDGDVSSISGLGTVTEAWNASSCKPNANTITEVEDQNLTRDIVNYLKNPDTKRLNDMYSRLAARGPASTLGRPLLQIGKGSSGGLGNIDIELDSTKLGDLGSVIKTKNKRIAAFPDFMMEWLTRQQEELVTSFFTPPNLTIVPPTNIGQNAQIDSSFENFSKKLGGAYSQASYDNLSKNMGAAFDKKSGDTKGTPDALKGIVGNTKGTLNSLKSAYTTIGKLPFISIKQSTIPLSIPWVDKRELDKYLRSLEGYKKEIENTINKMCVNDPSPQCLEKKARLQSGAFMSSILTNIKRIDDYKKFPIKIQKYITWKERYIVQVLCNIDTIQQITGGWLRDNGIRFRKWAELYTLIRAIADGWQPILDIFSDMNKSCGVCRNERNNLQYWKFKLLSMLIPSIPVLKFPKWPDIILDLSDVRFGITIAMPNFDPRISPIRLPALPGLAIGDLSAGLNLPAIGLLPPVPYLPDLPDLPSLPRIKLPNLPPPPKLPKIAGSLTAVLKIMKLISKMYCFYQNTSLVPEWQAGDVIAQRTERQGTLPFDFINLNLPQFSLPSLREIRVGSHVNYSLRSDFISEFARTAVKPINSFKTDLQLAMPSKVSDDIGIQGGHLQVSPRLPYNIESDHNSIKKILSEFSQDLDRDANVFLEVDEFITHILAQLDSPEFAIQRSSLIKNLAQVKTEAETMENELLVYNNKRFALLKDYVHASSDDVARLQNIVDLLDRELSSEPRQLISESTATRSTGLLDRYNQFQNTTSQVQTTASSQEIGLDRTKQSLVARFDRMIADTALGATTTSSTTASVAEGYSPNFQGIYIRTPSGVQTRLFDYIDPVRKDTRIDTLDIDRDGDVDYIYVLDGILYVKYSHKNAPITIQDTTVKISNVSQTDFDPYVPNYLTSNVSTPENMSFSFVPSLQTETEWRAEFYDRYTEWDRLDIGKNDPIKSPKTTIDMFLKVPYVQTEIPTLLSTPTKRSLASVRDTRSFAMMGRSVTVYTGALSFSLSPGRVLYTGADRVTITYKSQSSPTPKTITLNPYIGYQFTEVTELTTNGGKLYLIGQEDGSKYTYSDEYIGMPILPGMQIYASDAGSTIYDHTSQKNITLLSGTQYITYDLGTVSERYEVSVPYPNGYYYVRVSNLTEKKTDRAGIILMAPQESSDDGAPELDLPSRIRLPIYATRELQIADVVTDFGRVDVAIDGDLTIDTDKNGIFDDDFAKSGTGFRVTADTITFGKWVTPGNYTMNIRARDVMGNIITTPLIIEAYTLIPQIQAVTSTGTILGNIPEAVGSTPIHFFRVRSGEVPTLVSPVSTLTQTDGGFASGSYYKNNETIQIRSSGDAISVTNRGIFTLAPGYRVEIAPASAQGPMRILTLNQSGSIIYSHTISLPDGTMVTDASKMGPAPFKGIVINPTTGLSLVIGATLSDPAIPGGSYITDISRRPIIAMARDGNIYIADPTVSLRYKEVGGYMAIEVVRGSAILATIEYRIDFFYTVK